MKKILRKKIRIITEQLLVVRSGAAEESANYPSKSDNPTKVCPLCFSILVSPEAANQKSLPPAAQISEDDPQHQCSDTK